MKNNLCGVCGKLFTYEGEREPKVCQRCAGDVRTDGGEGRYGGVGSSNTLKPQLRRKPDMDSEEFDPRRYRAMGVTWTSQTRTDGFE